MHLDNEILFSVLRDKIIPDEEQTTGRPSFNEGQCRSSLDEEQKTGRPSSDEG